MITVGRKRKLCRRRRHRVRYADSPEPLSGHCHRSGDPVIACARSLPFDEALAMLIGSQRRGHEGSSWCACRENGGVRRSVAERPTAGRPLRVRGSSDLARVPACISNPKCGLPGITPDLVDGELRLIVECDSWMFHAEKSAFRRDMERYNTLVLRGWRVLRIGWEHAMKQPDYVRDVLARRLGVPSDRQFGARRGFAASRRPSRRRTAVAANRSGRTPRPARLESPLRWERVSRSVVPPRRGACLVRYLPVGKSWQTRQVGDRGRREIGGPDRYQRGRIPTLG